MKNVLLLVHDDPGQEARFQVALDLTRALSGHLTCLHVTPIALVVNDASYTAPALIIDQSDDEADNKLHLQRRLATEDVAWSWDDLRGDFVSAVLDPASTADVVVLNRKLDSSAVPDMRAITSEILTRCSALVVAVDETCRSLDLGTPALIAWDGSEGVMHALQRALPLLSRAASVKIFQVGEMGDDRIPAADAASYLSRHGINAEIEIAAVGHDTAKAIRAALERLGAGYCVMGVFGHGRLREALFGGVSREMLTRASVPLMLAH